MRSNLPVTQNEVHLTDSTMIVSKTNLKGQITYINKDFLEISGFTEAELIGSPHNIVRHPDMPSEVFTDLWATLKAGRPWIGIIKNRCKNGDHYWVEAHATPILENDQIIGYMSVRKMAHPNQIATAEAAYQLFRDKKNGKLQIRHGTICKNTICKGNRLITKLNDASIRTKITSTIMILVVLLIISGSAGLYGIKTINDSIRTIYEDRVAPLDQIANIADLLDRNRILVMDELLNPSPENINNKNAELEENINTVTTLWDAYLATMITPEEQVLADTFSKLRGEYIKSALRPTQQLIMAGKINEAYAAYTGKIVTMNPAVRNAAFKLAKIQSSITKDEYLKSHARFHLIFSINGILFLISIPLALLIGIFLARSVRTPITQATRILAQASQGMRLNAINIGRNDELGQMLQMLESWLTRLGFETAEKKRQADETLRIKIALDNVSTGVMIANTEREIIYVNSAVSRMLKKTESEIRKALPHFNADKLIGVNIDSFHKNPKHQADLLASLTSTHITRFNISNQHITLTANPVINNKNERLGSVVEWQDRTAEARVEEELASIVHGALKGNFDNRINTEGKEGFFKTLAEGLNNLADITSTGLNGVARVLQAVAHGDLTQKIDANYTGIFSQLKDDTNTTVERLREIISRIQDASDAINCAAMQISAGNIDISTRIEEQVVSLEQTSASMEEFSSTVRQNANHAKQANHLAQSSNDIAIKSGQIVQQIIGTMSGIAESSKKITDIISVIDSIAFQTNILALNAAVEAARAGEQGRGFAVVATEVRNLAHRSATAAKEIKELIMESSNKVGVGTKLVDQAGQSMAEVMSSFQQVTTLVTDIANASHEQASGIEQVTVAINRMDDSTQQNAALIEESTAAAESLKGQAHNLVQAVSMFKLTENTGDNSHDLPIVRTLSAKKPQPPR